MAVHDPEACSLFIARNRSIAARFTAKAERLLELAQSIEDLEERMRLADLVQFSEERAAKHLSIAKLQERDLGVKCHCNQVAAYAMDFA